MHTRAGRKWRVKIFKSTLQEKSSEMQQLCKKSKPVFKGAFGADDKSEIYAKAFANIFS